MMCVFPVIDNSTLKYLVSLLKICMPVLVISHKNDLNKQLSVCSMIAFDNAIDKSSVSRMMKKQLIISLLTDYR